MLRTRTSNIRSEVLVVVVSLFICHFRTRLAMWQIRVVVPKGTMELFHQGIKVPQSLTCLESLTTDHKTAGKNALNDSRCLKFKGSNMAFKLDV